jgi:nucleoside phosphorylase
MLQAFRALEAGKLLGERPWEAYADNALKRLSAGDEMFDRPPANTDILYAAGSVIDHPTDHRRREDRPRIHGGAIGTADILLKDPNLRDELNRNYGVKAVEMEGSGVQGAAWSLERDVMVIRGISDYCDTHKSDQWRYYAALVAAAYARALIEELPDEWFQ